MSVIIVLCEEPCPVHSCMCLLEKNHAMPHKTALRMRRALSKVQDTIVIEWRVVEEKEANDGTTART